MEVLASLLHQRLELVPVQLDPAGHQPIAASVVSMAAEPSIAPEPADAALDDLGPGRGPALRPERVRETFCGDGLAPPDRQGVEHQPVPRPRLPGGRVDLHRPEQPHSHLPIVGAPAEAVNRVDTRPIPPRPPSGTAPVDGGTAGRNRRPRIASGDSHEQFPHPHRTRRLVGPAGHRLRHRPADVDTARSAPREQVQAVAGGTYDGWAVRARWDAPSSCPWSPDQIERMMESGRPLPGCVRRLQRWFAEQYDARR